MCKIVFSDLRERAYKQTRRGLEYGTLFLYTGNISARQNQGGCANKSWRKINQHTFMMGGGVAELH